MSNRRKLRGGQHRSRRVDVSSLRPLRRLGLLNSCLHLEPLEQRYLLTADFGDAPAFYPTLISESGAQHTATGPTLGATRDSEANGTHSANANGDGADEDGVTFGTVQVGQLGASVTVNVQGGAARLDAWIDFNADGSWGGPGEQIFDNVAVSVGNNVLSFDVPSWAADGVTFARFRLSTAGGLGVRGLASNGEVEDYAVTIVPPVAASGIFGSQRVITAAANGAYSVFAADVDGDGDMDVLSAAYGDDKIAWHENDGSQNFTTHAISTTANGANSVFAADVDGDGDTDVLSASYFDDKIAWYENDGSQNFTAHTISTTANGARSVFAADMDGDGDTDVLSASGYDNKIAWYENNGNQNFTPHTISTTAFGALAVFAVDMDGDGDTDVVSASRYDETVRWYENDGSQNFSAHAISLEAATFSVFAADVDGDGDTDVLSASPYNDKIAWYENNGTQNFPDHTISSAANGAVGVFAADVDGDGDTDVLSASYADDKIAWYENNGSQNFTAHTVTTNADVAQGVFAADMDGDGDMDVLSASFNDDKIAWYENLNALDFGDAPQFYPTLISENGAVHGAVGPTLGPTRDIELDGTHSANATADGADEDGVSFGAIQGGQLGAAVTVNVQGGAARLDAWIDFNADGSWGGPGEQIFDNVAVAIGNNVLSFDVPSWAADGVTFARFRLSTAGDQGVGGLASDGEVEDYAVTINPPSATRGIFLGQHIVSAAADGAGSVFAVDVDGDGDSDILSASVLDDKITWYENDGSQNFTPHTITAAADGAIAVFAADIDGDGDTDIVAACYLNLTIAWYENDGSENFTAHTITTSANAPRSVFAADVDGDGDSDVLSASYNDDKIAWYENDGSQNFTSHTIATTNGAFSVFAADVDGDGDMDVASASFGADAIAWYENNGNQNFTAHVISTTADAASSVFVADVDGDGDIDLLSASFYDDRIAWYENDGSQNFTPHTITATADGAFSVFAADVDGDGDTDVLSASSFDDKIAWYKNDGSQNFTTQTISTAADGARKVFAADVDGDSDLDVLSASEFGDKIAWYENLQLDFGDAPQFYPTLFSENGARHIATGPRLGPTRDSEFDGMHSADASADGADEDGVSFGTIQVGQLGATVMVNVQGGTAKLDAWIDFNGDGSWGGRGEQIFDRVPVVVGNNILSFDVPSWAADGVTFARFRLGVSGNLGVSGLANDGEVEDYAVTIVPPAAASGVFVGQHVIDAAADGASSVFAADLDGDGDNDIISASGYFKRVVWYENTGSQSFTPHTISFFFPPVIGFVSVFAADVDGDGDTDVLSASASDDKITWYRNDGTPAVGTWSALTITSAADGALSVFAADVDGDGDTDVLSASYYDDRIAWYENNGNQIFTTHTISTSAAGALSVFATDVDGDGDIDVLSASSNDDKVAWYENDGNQNFTAHTISTSALEAASVFGADVDGDGDTDVLSASNDDSKVAWYENDGSQNFTIHTITAAAFGAVSVFAADVDGDGDIDVLSASEDSGKVAWYQNDGSQNFASHTISTMVDDAYGVFAADMDGDGDLDVLSASYGDDKIAWYENVNPDFGDAPQSYPTLLSENGAVHDAIGPTLGATRDIETNGTHSADATADGADEDGVSFGAIQVGQLGASVTVNVQGGAAKLDAWIDFNGDGSWGGPGEQIFDNVPVAVGNNVLNFDVPSWAADGVTFARFRLSTAGDLGVGGLAADGEVEDYAVTIVPPATASGVFLGQHVISAAADGAFSVFAADVDGDGDADVLSASRFDDKVAWYENDGNQNFTAHTISTTADGVLSVFAVDVDGDGDIDVLSASLDDDKIAWYENDGNQNFTAHTISLTADGAIGVFAADVDGDGDIDVLSASYADDKIAWYENDGGQNFTAHAISTTADGAFSVFVADVDGDGDSDVLSASVRDDKFAWYENDGSQNFTAHTISTTADGAQCVFAADVDGDGDTDVLSASRYDDTIAWYENDGGQNFTTHTISTTADGAISVFGADVDGDGDTDVVSASFYDNTVAWYENDGSQSFTDHTITTTASVARSVFAADVDSDGDLDVLSASEGDDKVAWYENRNRDFGDAPQFYPTLLSENGAVHDAVGPTLGATRDSEVNGAHSANATADGADEDGVSFGTIQVGQLGATVTVNVQGGAARLDAWIDFNGDGSWGGSGEHIFDTVSVSVGNNILSFDVPSWAADGVMFARFRLSTAGDLGVGGFAADGEVEDYAVTITPPAATSGFFLGEHLVTSSANGALSVFAADMDGDGDADVLSASIFDDRIAWYENDGSQHFTAHTISTTADGARSVFAADVDGDGDIDVLSASFLDDKIAWYENDGSQNFTEHAISTTADGAFSVFAADVDGDGDTDVLSASLLDDKIAWYENDGSQNFTAHTISSTADEAFNVFAADVDGDGDTDVLSASFLDDKIAWYENDGSQNFTAHTISSAADGAFNVFAADMDGDGDTDVLSASFLDDKIAWYENDGSQNFAAHTISTTADGASSVFAADVDGDGDPDVLSTSFFDDKIAWYENDGNQNFTEHAISTTADRAYSVFAADVDGDGDMDVLSALRDDGKIAWYENDPDPSSVVKTNLFYKNSTKWNVANGVTFSDDNAIAPDKTAYLPGSGTSAFSAVSSYYLGINGIMVDLSGAHGTITVSDFTFKRGNNNSPSTWATAPAPTTVTTRAGAGASGSDRVELLWAANAIQKTWLEVIVEGNDTLGGFNTNTGLSQSYVFFFGSAIGDAGVGNSGAFQVTSSDEVNARNNPKTLSSPATRDDVNDFNRNGLVDSGDQIIARNNTTSLGNQLKFLVVGAGGPFAPEAGSASGDSQTGATRAMVGPLTESVSTEHTGEAPGDAGISTALASGVAGSPVATNLAKPAGTVSAAQIMPLDPVLVDDHFRDAAGELVPHCVSTVARLRNEGSKEEDLFDLISADLSQRVFGPRRRGRAIEPVV
jgi:hypothetical protein